MNNGSSSSSSSSSRGVGFCGMLTILFIAFKLLGIITWSWLWVLSPLWIGAALVIAILLIIIFIAIIASVGNN